MPKFTDAFLKKFKPENGAKDRLAFDTELQGLGVRATASGKSVFILQWTDPPTKKKLREPLGVWGSITIEQARTAARVRLGKIAAGINPAAERAAAKAEAEQKRLEAAAAKEAAQFTLDALVTDWSKKHLSKRRERYSTEAQRALRFAFEKHLKRPAAALDHSAVVETLDKIAGAGSAPMAGRVLSYGRACYNWAVARRELPANPFAGLPAIEDSTPSRDRVLTDAEIGAIWRGCESLGWPFAPVVRLLLLTGQRREEVAAMRWSELDQDLSIWTLPALRVKNGREHLVHLAPAAQEILRSVARVDGQDFVFSTTGTTPPSGFSRAKSSLDRVILKNDGLAKPWRIHDFRRSVVTWLAGAGFGPHVCDRLLNHLTGTISGVAAVYQRAQFLPEREAALKAWATHVLHCANKPEAQDNGELLRGAAA